MPITSNDSTSAIHRLLLGNCEPIHISSYAVRPQPVFENAVVNTSIITFIKNYVPCEHLFTTKMYRKGAGFSLDRLVNNIGFINTREFVRVGRFAKISDKIEATILRKLFKQTPIRDLLNDNGDPVFYRTVGGRYFKVVTNYSTGSNKEDYFLIDSKYRDIVACILSSNLAFWFYQVYSNNLSWSSYDIFDFTIPVENLTIQEISNLELLYKEYEEDIERNVNIRQVSSSSRYTMDFFKEYKIVRSKPIIDRIDDYIAPLYGLTDEERDFIKYYELEFRMAGDE